MPASVSPTQAPPPSPAAATQMATQVPATPPATPAPVVVPSVEPDLTPDPGNAIKQFASGEVITVTQDGADWAQIVVSKVSVKTRYGSGYFVDKPAKGNVYIQAYVTYKALQNGVDYNPFDWQVFAAGEAVDTFTFVTAGPTPTLGSGTLPKGRTAKGWVIYEVPARGQVVMSYQDNMFSDNGPLFEVVLRNK